MPDPISERRANALHSLEKIIEAKQGFTKAEFLWLITPSSDSMPSPEAMTQKDKRAAQTRLQRWRTLKVTVPEKFMVMLSAVADVFLQVNELDEHLRWLINTYQPEAAKEEVRQRLAALRDWNQKLALPGTLENDELELCLVAKSPSFRSFQRARGGAKPDWETINHLGEAVAENLGLRADQLDIQIAALSHDADEEEIQRLRNNRTALHKLQSRVLSAYGTSFLFKERPMLAEAKAAFERATALAPEGSELQGRCLMNLAGVQLQLGEQEGRATTQRYERLFRHPPYPPQLRAHVLHNVISAQLMHMDGDDEGDIEERMKEASRRLAELAELAESVGGELEAKIRQSLFTDPDLREFRESPEFQRIWKKK